MDRTGDIRLDPDVLGFDMEAGVDSQLPLSDLYELPVFAKETKQKAGKYQREEKQMMERVCTADLYRNIKRKSSLRDILFIG